MRRLFVRSFLVGLGLTAAATPAMASFTPAAGYAVTNLGVSVPSFGVSASGEFATATYSGNVATVTLYDTWKAGRSVIGTATITGPANQSVFTTDITFASDNTLLIGDNGATKTLYQVTFNGGNATVDHFATGTFNGIQSIGVKGNQVVVSGTDNQSFDPGDYYLKTLNLSNDVTAGNVISNSSIDTLASLAKGNIGAGYVGGTAITPGSKELLLDDTGNVQRYDAAGNLIDTTSLNNGGGGAYGIATDGSTAYVSSFGQIEQLTTIDGQTVGVNVFGSFTDADFHFITGMGFVDGRFVANESGTGALLFNDADTGQLFAIQSLPEPASLSCMAIGGLLILRRRRIGR